MINPKLEVRLPPIMHAYLEDLASIGWGSGKAAVARRFIENEVTKALQTRIIEKRHVTQIEGQESQTKEE